MDHPFRLALQEDLATFQQTKKENKRKNEVRKDLVISRDGDKSVYDEDWRIHIAPLAIIEWKARTTRMFDGDLEFLRAVTVQDRYPSTFGVAVSVDFNPARVKAVFVTEGQDSALLEWPQP